MQSRWNGPYFPKSHTLKYEAEVFELGTRNVLQPQPQVPRSPLKPGAGAAGSEKHQILGGFGWEVD